MTDREARHREYMREWAKRRYAQRTPEEIEQHRAYMREYMNRRNAAMTPEERAEFNAAKREYNRERRANETPEQREKRLASMRAYAARRKADSPDVVLARNLQYAESRRQKELTAPERRTARLEVTQRLYRALRQTALVRYSADPPRCACCGETHVEFLVIDHIGGGGSRHRRELRGGNIYNWLKRQGYPDGYRVLCHNCNFAIRLGDPCPHEREKILPFARAQGGCS